VARYRIRIAPSAAKQFDSLPKKERTYIGATIDALADDPRPVGCSKIKAAGDNVYRVRRGDYRVLYAVYDDYVLVQVLKVGNRRDVYRNPEALSSIIRACLAKYPLELDD
jgi:mRNA interferase RelE/StbE